MPKVQKTVKLKKPRNFISTVGRRKTATVRVRLFTKSGQTIVNDQPIEHYFPGEINKQKYLKPLQIVNAVDKFYFTAKVTGSGKVSQLDAVVHGLSRALSLANPDEFKPLLKKAGFLTRDPRMKESRKVGTGGKARRKKQSPKR